jgi:hypothetical protein
VAGVSATRGTLQTPDIQDELAKIQKHRVAGAVHRVQCRYIGTLQDIRKCIERPLKLNNTTVCSILRLGFGVEKQKNLTLLFHFLRPIPLNANYVPA